MLQELRADRTAPVDTVGAEAIQLSQPAKTRSAFEYQTLIALMLSSQTKDPMVAKAVSRLKNGLGKHGLSVEGEHLAFVIISI